MLNSHVKFHSTSGKRLVLIVDDEQINREMLVYLGRDGAVLEIAIGDIGSIALPV